MKLILAYNGKLKNEFRSLFEEYKKRLDLEVLEFKTREQLNRFAEDKKFVLLSERGKEFNTLEFKDFLKAKKSEGKMVFVVGDDEGFDPTLQQKASFILALSKMTMPHDLAKIVLLEQLFRVETILAGKEYHK